MLGVDTHRLYRGSEDCGCVWGSVRIRKGLEEEILEFRCKLRVGVGHEKHMGCEWCVGGRHMG